VPHSTATALGQADVYNNALEDEKHNTDNNSSKLSYVNISISSAKGLIVNIFCKKPNSKHIRLCGPYTVYVVITKTCQCSQ
jgi:hypothetical protein